MTYIVRITDDADRQMRQAYRWYLKESRSETVASRWYHGFLAKIESLKDNPEACSLAHESDDFPYDLRQLLYGSGKRKKYRALFRIKGNIVEVLAIRHHSQRDVTPDDFS